MATDTSLPTAHRRRLTRAVTSGVLLVVLVGALVTYKSAGAVRQLDEARVSGTVAARADVVPVSPMPAVGIVSRSLNYLSVIWPALLFGLLIAAAVRAFTPVAAVSRLLGRGPVRQQIVAGAAGAPLMLCSCCVAPIFSSVYARSSRLGPALALMIAAPALNPAALALTFLLFSSQIAVSRLAMSLVAVFLGTAIVARLAARGAAAPRLRVSDPLDESCDVGLEGGLARAFLRSFARIAIRTVPPIVVGVLLAMAVADYLPLWMGSPSGRVWVVAIAASLALPLALPTFFEIPLAVAVLAAGAPAGAAAAVLFAGPAVNLPSLLAVGQAAGWRTTVLSGLMVWLVAVLGGLAIG